MPVPFSKNIRELMAIFKGLGISARYGQIEPPNCGQTLPAPLQPSIGKPSPRSRD
jgi:hypothetical protein